MDTIYKLLDVIVNNGYSIVSYGTASDWKAYILFFIKHVSAVCHSIDSVFVFIKRSIDILQLKKLSPITITIILLCCMYILIYYINNLA